MFPISNQYTPSSHFIQPSLPTFTSKEIKHWQDSIIFQSEAAEGYNSFAHIYQTLSTPSLETTESDHPFVHTYQTLSTSSSNKLLELKSKISLLKNITLRPPHANEYLNFHDVYGLVDELSCVVNFEEFKMLAENQGSIKKGVEIHHFALLCNNSSSKIEGVIHFHFNVLRKVCEIDALAVKKNKRQKGYGSLLLVYALAKAHFEQYDHIKVYSLGRMPTLSFYSTFNFRPEKACLSDSQWNELDLTNKLQGIINHTDIEENEVYLVLNLLDSNTKNILNNKLSDLQLTSTIFE